MDGLDRRQMALVVETRQLDDVIMEIASSRRIVDVIVEIASSYLKIFPSQKALPLLSVPVHLKYCSIFCLHSSDLESNLVHL